jgi:hypothetical protein
MNKKTLYLSAITQRDEYGDVLLLLGEKLKKGTFSKRRKCSFVDKGE